MKDELVLVWRRVLLRVVGKVAEVPSVTLEPVVSPRFPPLEFEENSLQLHRCLASDAAQRVQSRSVVGGNDATGSAVESVKVAADRRAEG